MVWYVERRPVDSLVRRVVQMGRSQTTRDREKPKKTIREIIKKDFEIDDLNRIMVLDRILWEKLINIYYIFALEVTACVAYLIIVIVQSKLL